MSTLLTFLFEEEVILVLWKLCFSLRSSFLCLSLFLLYWGGNTRYVNFFYFFFSQPDCSQVMRKGGGGSCIKCIILCILRILHLLHFLRILRRLRTLHILHLLRILRIFVLPVVFGVVRFLNQGKNFFHNYIRGLLRVGGCWCLSVEALSIPLYYLSLWGGVSVIFGSAVLLYFMGSLLHPGNASKRGKG